MAIELDISADVGDGIEDLNCPILVLTDLLKIYRLVDEKDLLFRIDHTWDLVDFCLTTDIYDILRYGWSQITLTDRQLILNGQAYNLNS